jgi:adenylylsulfate kinase
MIYWFTGQPGHGKTTLAKALILHLEGAGENVFHVDGDDLRALTVNSDYSKEGRINNIKKAQTIAHYLHSKGEVVVVSLVAPYKDLREEFKNRVQVQEIFVHTSEVRGRENKHAADYEPPVQGYLDVDTTNKSVDECLATIIGALF